MKYFIYKITNNLLCFFWNRNTALPVLKFKNVNYIDGVHFDLSHPTTHLGDRLFFFPLIKALYEKNIPLNISDDGITEKLFYAIYGVQLKLSKKNYCLNVCPKPSLLNFIKKYNNLIVCDFTDLKIKNKITSELINSFNLLFNLNLVESNLESKKTPNIFQIFGIDDDFNYIIFNNYVNSGFFRINFLNKKKLIEKCIAMKMQGFRVIHVGSAEDKKNDAEFYNFVDIDLRGYLSLNELVSMIRCSNIVSIITFDNFLMHLGHMFNKKTWVLFRGRFIKSNYLHHIRYVNNTFLTQGMVKYL